MVFHGFPIPTGGLAIFSNNQGVNYHLMSNGGRLWPTNPRLTNWMALGFPLSYPYIQFLILYIYMYLIYIPIDWCVHPKIFVAENHKSYRCPHRSLSFLPILYWLVEDTIPFMDCDIPQYNWLVYSPNSSTNRGKISKLSRSHDSPPWLSSPFHLHSSMDFSQIPMSKKENCVQIATHGSPHRQVTTSPSFRRRSPQHFAPPPRAQPQRSVPVATGCCARRRRRPRRRRLRCLVWKTWWYQKIRRLSSGNLTWIVKITIFYR